MSSAFGASLNSRCASSKNKTRQRLVRVADFRQLLEQFRQEPQQKRRVEARVHHQLVGRKNADETAAIRIGAHDIGDLQRRFAEELGTTLLFQHQQRALDRADGGLGDIAVTGRDLLGPFSRC